MTVTDPRMPSHGDKDNSIFKQGIPLKEQHPTATLRRNWRLVLEQNEVKSCSLNLAEYTELLITLENWKCWMWQTAIKGKGWLLYEPNQRVQHLHVKGACCREEKTLPKTLKITYKISTFFLSPVYWGGFCLRIPKALLICCLIFLLQGQNKWQFLWQLPTLPGWSPNWAVSQGKARLPTAKISLKSPSLG